jgi:hypothetical protein
MATFTKKHFMEKILLAANCQYLDRPTIEFACYMTKLTKSKLTAIFLQESAPDAKSCLLIEEADGITHFEKISFVGQTEVEREDQNYPDYISLFMEVTQQAGIPADIDLKHHLSAAAVSEETRFADLLILDAFTPFSAQPGEPAAGSVKGILQHAECPVIISPREFNGVENVIFCYDGSKSSVFAIKQFTYLFPQWKGIDAKVLYLNESGGLSEEERSTLTDWLGYHYRNVQILIPPADSANAFIDFVVERRSDIVVMGAYGHGLLDAFFGKDPDSDEAGSTTLPIFISHY